MKAKTETTSTSVSFLGVIGEPIALVPTHLQNTYIRRDTSVMHLLDELDY